MNTPRRHSSGFTLIELLVVIAIIGILMSLLFPAVGGAINAARKAQARNDVVQIATACVAYETEYGVGPHGGTNVTEVKGDFLDKLMGTNSRGIVFLEVQDVGQKKKPGYSGGVFQDPWGGVYQITCDTNYRSDIKTAGTNGSTAVRRNYAVWTDPSKQKWYTNFSADKRYVESW